MSLNFWSFILVVPLTVADDNIIIGRVAQRVTHGSESADVEGDYQWTRARPSSRKTWDNGQWHINLVSQRPLYFFFVFDLSLSVVASAATFFMIVNFPDEAATATCASMLLWIFALSSLCRAAVFAATAFFGAMYRCPFFGWDAALAACRAADDLLF